jgi:hypothetical protein
MIRDAVKYPLPKEAPMPGSVKKMERVGAPAASQEAPATEDAS